MALYLITSGNPNTTPSAAAPTIATANGIKTVLQLKPFNRMKIVEYGVSFDFNAAATPVKVELMETGTVFATVTASVDADVMKLEGTDQAAASVAGLTLGTSATGYNSSNEGVVTVSRLFDVQLIAPTNQYIKQFPLGREPALVIGNACRIRVTATVTTYNLYAYMVVDI
jgi:hypothetical protein